MYQVCFFRKLCGCKFTPIAEFVGCTSQTGCIQRKNYRRNSNCTCLSNRNRPNNMEALLYLSITKSLNRLGNLKCKRQARKSEWICIFSTIFSLYSYSSWTAPNLCVTPNKTKIYTQSLTTSRSSFYLDKKVFHIMDLRSRYIICSDFSCFEWMNQFLFGGNRKLFWDYWETQVRALDYSCVYEPNVWTFPH